MRRDSARGDWGDRDDEGDWEDRGDRDVEPLRRAEAEAEAWESSKGTTRLQMDGFQRKSWIKLMKLMKYHEIS